MNHQCKILMQREVLYYIDELHSQILLKATFTIFGHIIKENTSREIHYLET